MHGIADQMRSNEYVAREPVFERSRQGTRVRNDEAETVAMHGQPPHHEILVGGGLRERIPIRFDSHQRAAADHLSQPRVEFAPLVPMQTKFAHQLLESRRALRLLRDVFENSGIGEHERAVSLQPSAFSIPHTVVS
jgi:hypothetical protein